MPEKQRDITLVTGPRAAYFKPENKGEDHIVWRDPEYQVPLPNRSRLAEIIYDLARLGPITVISECETVLLGLRRLISETGLADLNGNAAAMPLHPEEILLKYVNENNEITDLRMKINSYIVDIPDDMFAEEYGNYSAVNNNLISDIANNTITMRRLQNHAKQGI